MLTYVKSRLINRKLDNVGVNSLEWLWTHRDGFRIENSSGKEVPWQVKPLIELIFLLIVLKRNGHESLRTTQLTCFAIDTAKNFDWHQFAAYDPSAGGPIALIRQLFQMENEPIPFEDDYFTFLLKAQFFEGMDRLPFRQMDYIYSMKAANVSGYDINLEILFSNTAFGRKQHLARYSIDDIYSLTHAIFYLSDVGIQPDTPALDNAMSARMRCDLVSLTAMMVRGGNMDVLGELLICWLMCKVERTDIFTQAIHFLQTHINSDGSLAPTTRIFEKSKAGNASFDDLYHTTLVSALLFALLTKTKNNDTSR